MSLLVIIGNIFAITNAEDSTNREDQIAWNPISTEFTRVQSGDWINSDVFAVGRWDGTLTVFRMPHEGEYTPVLLGTLSTSKGDGVEMLLATFDGYLIYSDTISQLGVWNVREKSKPALFPYAENLGTANSALVFSDNDESMLVTGHANGFIALWRYDSGNLSFVRAIDLRSDNPINSPYPLKNIRGLAHWKNNLIITGSEDGDISVVNINNDQVIFRTRYNATAQRGINNISVIADNLLLANCSVGSDDYNLWLYKLSDRGIELKDSINLIKDTSRHQSFNFDADLFEDTGVLRFLASTEEGILWAGRVEDSTLVVEKTASVASDGGALIDVAPSNKRILAAARKIYIFGMWR